MPSSDIEIFIEELTEEDNKELASFSCGEEELDKFFHNEMLICSKYHYIASYCARDKSNGKIVAVFTLANDAVILGNPEDKADFMEQSSYKIPKEYKSVFEQQTSFPAVNIGHLGVRTDVQSRGIGRSVLEFVLHTFISFKVSGCQFVTVDSLNNQRTNKFYASNGFNNLTDKDTKQSTRRMYLPIELYRDNEEDEEE